MKNLIILTTMMIFANPVFGDINQVVIIERNLEERVSNFVHSIDPNAQVYIRLQVKEINVQLPGTTFNFVGIPSAQKIESENIESISAHILSEVSPFPEWAKARIEEMLSFPNVKTQLAFDIFKESDLNQLNILNPGRQVQSISGKILGFTNEYGFIVLALCISLALTLVGWLLFILPQFIRNQINQVLSRTSQDRDANQDSATPLSVADDSSQSGTVDANSATQDIALPAEGLVELMADCYWAELDNYAAWIWSRLTPNQCEELINQWPNTSEYANYFLTLSPKLEPYHKSPYYIHPHKFRDLSISDMNSAIQKQPNVWQMLSPIRKAQATLPIEKKIHQLQSPIAKKDPVSFDKKSTARKLKNAASIGLLTVEDDLAIWNNKDLIPAEMRSETMTLVWMALLEDDVRRKVCAEFTAADFARAWVGPQEVLEKILHSMPEKKQSLLLSYAKNSQPSRLSLQFRLISKRAALALETSTEDHSENLKAS